MSGRRDKHAWRSHPLTDNSRRSWKPDGWSQHTAPCKWTGTACLLNRPTCYHYISLSLWLYLVLFMQVILDLKGSDYSYSYQTPPASPSNTLSRKSSISRWVQGRGEMFIDAKSVSWLQIKDFFIYINLIHIFVFSLFYVYNRLS